MKIKIYCSFEKKMMKIYSTDILYLPYYTLKTNIDKESIVRE